MRKRACVYGAHSHAQTATHRIAPRVLSPPSEGPAFQPQVAARILERRLRNAQLLGRGSIFPLPTFDNRSESSAQEPSQATQNLVVNIQNVFQGYASLSLFTMATKQIPSYDRTDRKGNATSNTLLREHSRRQTAPALEGAAQPPYQLWHSFRRRKEEGPLLPN